MTLLSVILCTHNPDLMLLDEAIAALSVQAVDFEFILVDNNSTPAVDEDCLAPFLGNRALMVRESCQGLAHARRRGVRESTGDLVCFVDDDNILARDYLAQALRIAHERPEIGAFAGRAHGRFGKPPSWIHRRHIARYAVRDLGDQRLSGPGDYSGQWEPFGAGLVVRRDVAEGYCRLVEATATAAGMGRSSRTGSGSGEDSLFSRVAHRLGYEVSYEPALALEHIIPTERLTLRYLATLVAGQARAQAALDRLRGERVQAPPSRYWEPVLLLRRFASRCRNPGLGEAISHVFWDLGYWSGQREYAVDDEQAIAATLDALEAERRLPAHGYGLRNP